MEQINRWTLTQEVEEKYFDKVENFLKKGGVLDLSDTELNPARLECMLEHFEFEVVEKETNGTDFDTMMHNYNDDEYVSILTIRVDGMTFNLSLVSE